MHRGLFSAINENPIIAFPFDPDGDGHVADSDGRAMLNFRPDEDETPAVAVACYLHPDLAAFLERARP
ncbi:MAG: hypothetical protein ACKVPY_09735 [Paracoccaceae bacterium]